MATQDADARHDLRARPSFPCPICHQPLRQEDLTAVALPAAVFAEILDEYSDADLVDSTHVRHADCVQREVRRR